MTKIFICTPAYDGKVSVQYALALAETIVHLAQNAIPTEIKINTSGSLLAAERNRLTQAFMESDCTHMLCIDSDLGWPAQAVLAMIEKDEEFVVGVYPSRREHTFLFRPVFNPDGSVLQTEKNLLGMMYVPAGFMLIRRSVIEKMQLVHPHLYFEPKHDAINSSKGYCLFNTEVWEGEFWGEDYYFCRKAREASVQIWADPLIEFDHDGMRGCLMQALTQNRDDRLVPPESLIPVRYSCAGPS
jgi:hypothetical protein